MRLSDCIEVLARRLGAKRGRIAGIANRLQHAGAIPLAEARKTPPELAVAEITLLLIAVLAENGVGTAAERTRQYAGMTSPDGFRLAETFEGILSGQFEAGSFIFREGGVAAHLNGRHVIFGDPAEDGQARFITAATLAAISAEFRGVPKGHADAVAQLNRIIQ